MHTEEVTEKVIEDDLMKTKELQALDDPTDIS